MPTRKRHSSVDGCCVCGVDTSSQPFLRSDEISANKRVSSEVYQYCFKVEEERSGDICVDCLSIAKKWIKLCRKKRFQTDYSELVDSKRTPKSSMKRKRSRRNSSRNSKETEPEDNSDKATNHELKQESCPDKNDEEQIDEKIVKIEEQTTSIVEDALSEDDNEDMDVADGSAVEFETPCLSPGKPENDSVDQTKQEKISVATQTAFLFPALTSPQANANKLPFIDLSKWRQEDICCGTIFRGPNGEVLVDPKWLRSSCEMCNRSSQPPTPIEASKSQSLSVFDDKLSSLCS